MIEQMSGSGQITSKSDLVVAIESATLAGSVAIGRGGTLLAERSLPGTRDHARELLPALRDLCHEHDVSPREITAIFVSAGPGSFTGLRIGLTAARTLSMATGAMTVPVPTLTVIAQNALTLTPVPRHVGVMLDAKRQHVFACQFRVAPGSSVALDEPHELAPQAFLAMLPDSSTLLGEGAMQYADLIRSAGHEVGPQNLHDPRAACVLSLGAALLRAGKAVAYRDLVPTYVRRPEAQEKWEARHGVQSSLTEPRR